MANEKRLIDANAVLEKLSRMIDYCKTDKKVNATTALFQVGDAIMDCPTVDAVEVVHGRWVSDKADILFHCSVCETQISTDWDYDDLSWNYCPNCGAYMRERSTNV